MVTTIKYFLPLHKNMFNSERLKKYDCVFDPDTYTKKGNVRASLYMIMYVSRDHKSVLIAKAQTHILRKSKYPNSESPTTDRYYNQANLHLKYLCHDTRHLNFICQGDDTSEFVSFDPDWSPMRMSELMGNVMTDDTLAIHISSPVISSRNNIDLKHIIKLIEDESDKHHPQKINNDLELKQHDQVIIEFPQAEIKTRSGRKITAPECFTY